MGGIPLIQHCIHNQMARDVWVRLLLSCKREKENRSGNMFVSDRDDPEEGEIDDAREN